MTFILILVFLYFVIFGVTFRKRADFLRMMTRGERVRFYGSENNFNAWSDDIFKYAWLSSMYLFCFSWTLPLFLIILGK